VLRTACHNTIVAPVKTNAAFLARCLAHPDFVSGDVDTGFIPRHEHELIPSASPSSEIVECAAMAVLHDEMGDKQSVQLWRYESRKEPQPFAGSAWRSLAGFRLNAPEQLRIALSYDGETFIVERPTPKPGMFSTIVKGDEVLVTDMGQSFLFTRERATGAAAGSGGDGAIVSPMPGKLISVEVQQGDVVSKGQKLLTLEAMKMEHSLVAPFDGIVAELNASEGAQVTEGTLLVRIEKGEGE
jgi:3-methylcrotonyl-CoA carboxylase alpha subunit